MGWGRYKARDGEEVHEPEGKWRLEDTSIKARPSYWTITRVVPNKIVAKPAVCVARLNGLATQNCARFIPGCSDENGMVTEDIKLCIKSLNLEYYLL